jgi:orotate phosphoribosyltransferase
MNKESLMLDVLAAGAVEIRDVDNGAPPFKYSSGHFGPGYVMIKGLVAQGDLLRKLVAELAIEVLALGLGIDFVAGNVSGGVIPGWLLAECLNVPFVYVRETRKAGGQKEHITGERYIPQGSVGLVVEELVNFASTTVNSAEVLRLAGFETRYAACILFYGHKESIQALEEHDMHMVHLFTLPELLAVAEKHRCFSHAAIDSYREFLADTSRWEQVRGLIPDPKGGTK